MSHSINSEILESLFDEQIDAVSERGYNSLIYILAAILMITIIFIGNTYDCDLLETS